MLALDVHDIRVAAASAADTVLLNSVIVGPVLVFFFPLLFVLRCELKEGLARALPRGCVRGTVLDGGVPVAEVTKVVDVARREKGASSEGVDRGITPLGRISTCVAKRAEEEGMNLLAPSRILHCGPSSGRSLHTPCSGKS